MIELNDIENHLVKCSESFVPPLSEYVNISEYAKKIFKNAILFTEVHKSEVIGLLAVYDNTNEKHGWITNVSVIPKFHKKGIATKLLLKCITFFKFKAYKTIFLEVFIDNENAIDLYLKNNFTIYKKTENKLILKQNLRNYDNELNDTEDHKYAYNFDFDVMHPYYIKSSINHVNISKSCLELGSSRGHFTERLLKYFDSVVCVEGSNLAIQDAKERLKKYENKNIKFIHSLFENFKSETFSNIFLTHVLEHLENPVELLKQINNELLTDDGTLIIICPNANAPSRQIAVKMGIISHNTAITSAEKEHGHHITYTLDTLERDAKDAGLNILMRSGIFFKALANFQWDELLKTKIISQEYLDGCYALGQQYPDLCSSIMLVCKKGIKK